MKTLREQKKDVVLAKATEDVTDGASDELEWVLMRVGERRSVKWTREVVWEVMYCEIQAGSLLCLRD